MVGQMTQSLFKKLALLVKYEEILQKATAAAEDRKLSGSIKYKCCLEVCPNPVVLAQQLCHIEMVSEALPKSNGLRIEQLI